MEQGEGGEIPPRKLQSDSTVAAGASDFPTKKLARQLVFTATCGASTGVVLPEHPQLPPAQAQLQPQLPPLPTPVALMPVPPQAPAPPTARAVKPESPKSRGRSNVEVKEGTPKKQKQCNCKHSKCLKLYCECFASGVYCDGCNCLSCYNNVDNDAARREAIEATLERNPNAFRPKIASSPHGARDSREEAGEVLVLGKHNKGCHCKKSGCLKKYCECFQANILCSDNCKCMDCKNFEGSEERQALFHGEHSNSFAYIQQAANAAITGAIGSSGFGSPPMLKRRKSQELFFGQTAKDPPFQRFSQFQQTTQIKASSPLPSVPVARSGSSAALGPSKFTYRSLLADIIQPHDLKELCSVLVVLSEEAARTQEDRNDALDKQAVDQTETSLPSSSQDRLQSQKESDAENAAADDCSSRNQADKISPENSNSDGADVPKGRPMSPATLALMCDEQDTMFMAPASPNEIMGNRCNTSLQLPNGQGMTELYMEQERLVLTKFKDCLNRLITFGEIKETKCSSLAKIEVGNQDSNCNGTLSAKTEAGSQPEPVSNGIARSVHPTIRASQMVTVATGSNSFPKVSPLTENGNLKPKLEKEL